MAPHLSTAFKNSGSAIGHIQGAPRAANEGYRKLLPRPALNPQPLTHQQ